MNENLILITVKEGEKGPYVCKEGVNITPTINENTKALTKQLIDEYYSADNDVCGREMLDFVKVPEGYTFMDVVDAVLNFMNIVDKDLYFAIKE